MVKGFVLGKFMPLHTGHLALINFALQHCDFLYIILCSTENECITGKVRLNWLAGEFSANKKISIIDYQYDETKLPNTSVSSKDVSRKWAAMLSEIVPGASVIVSSEKYGEYLAGYLNISHVLFDENRQQTPVSASLIRDNPFRYWEYIAKPARSYFIKKIVIVGSESTGKSTLTEQLALHYKTNYVAEMARAIIEKTQECTPDHLSMIAIAHANEILKQAQSANKLLFIDTDLHVTASYSQFLFQKELVVESWIEEANFADLYFFLETDCPFIQDGTRLSELERNRLSIFHKNQLEKNGINFFSITGTWEDRFSKMVLIINNCYFK